MRTRGTPVNKDTFMEWKVKYDREMARKKVTEEEDRLRAMSPKEREEYKKYNTRLTGELLLH